MVVINVLIRVCTIFAAYSGMGGVPGGAGRGLASLAPWSGVPVRPQNTPNIIDQSSFPSLGGSQSTMAPPGLSGIGRGNPIAGIGRGAPVAQIVNPGLYKNNYWLTKL